MVYCISCGQSLPSEHIKLCPNCGNSTIISGNSDNQREYYQQHKGTSTIKIIGIAAGVIVGIFIIIAIAGASVSPGSIYQANPDDIQGISQFVVMEEGSSVLARFSLVTPDNVYVTSDATVKFIITDGNDNIKYSQNFDGKARDF